MSKYTLHYFGVNGRAAIARAVLSYAKADWTNDLIKNEDWPKIKTSGLCEYEQVPVLEVGGKKYCESNAINLYLAETFDLLGKDVEENYQINNLLMSADDYTKVARELYMCTDESKKPELKKKTEDKLKFLYTRYEKKYIDFGKGKYFLGDKFTLGDIFLTVNLFYTLQSLGLPESGCKDVAPNVTELAGRVKENELKEFFEKYFIK